MRVRVRTNANKEAFHGKQLNAFLRRRPLTAVTYCYLPNRVRRWKKLADGKRSKLSRGGDGLNLPWTGPQRERERERERERVPTNHRRGGAETKDAAKLHGCPRSTVNRLDMAEKQVVAVASTSSSGSEPSSVPLVSDPRPTQSNGPPEQSTAAVSPHATRPASRPRP